MNALNKIKSFWNAIAVVAFLFASEQMQGMNQYTFDLESLVDMSPQIVEGQLGGERRINNITVQQFKISAVHKGNLKVGQTLILRR